MGFFIILYCIIYEIDLFLQWYIILILIAARFDFCMYCVIFVTAEK